MFFKVIHIHFPTKDSVQLNASVFAHSFQCICLFITDSSRVLHTILYKVLEISRHPLPLPPSCMPFSSFLSVGKAQ